MNVDGILVAALAETMARALVQSCKAGIGENFAASVLHQHQMLRCDCWRCCKGYFHSGLCPADQRPIAKLFNEMVKSRYSIHAPDL